MVEATSVLAVLAATVTIILGLLRFLVWFARNSNTDYQALAKVLERERADRLKITAERDEWKLNALKYADQREEAMRYATHWRDKYKQVIAVPPLLPLAPEPPPQRPDASQITRFDMEVMRVEIEAETNLDAPPSGTEAQVTLKG